MRNPDPGQLCKLLNIKIPIIQGGMVWASGWKLASAVSNAGGLGLIGAGSMYPDVFLHHVQQCKQHVKGTFGVNLPLLYPDLEEIFAIIFKEKIKVVFTSAGNPALYTQRLKEAGCTVFHVVSNSKFGLKAMDAGVDGLVAEGFEAGGHNGREETTTLCLIPLIRQITEKPLIAAGGIADGRSMAAVMTLGADGVQMGSRFVMSQESSVHLNYKEKIKMAGEGDTALLLKSLTPVRLLKNTFQENVKKMESLGADQEKLKVLLGKGRAKKGMFEGDMEEGELEIGQVSSRLKEVLPAADIVRQCMHDAIQANPSLFAGFDGLSNSYFS